jgi:hypothetical protein
MTESIKLGDIVYLVGIPDKTYRIISEEKINKEIPSWRYYEVVNTENDVFHIVHTQSIKKVQKLSISRFEDLDI